jgi:hypothetical protein
MQDNKRQHVYVHEESPNILPVKVSISTMSLSSVNVHRLPGFTFSRQTRQKGHDLDLVLLQSKESELQLL